MVCETHSSPIQAPVLEIILVMDFIEIRHHASRWQFLEAHYMLFYISITNIIEITSFNNIDIGDVIELMC